MNNWEIAGFIILFGGPALLILSVLIDGIRNYIFKLRKAAKKMGITPLRLHLEETWQLYLTLAWLILSAGLLGYGALISE